MAHVPSVQGAWEVAAHWRQALPGGGPTLQGEGPLSTAVIAALSFWDYSLVQTLCIPPPPPPPGAPGRTSTTEANGWGGAITMSSPGKSGTRFHVEPSE